MCILEQSCCRNFPFYLFSESRTFHHLFSSFLVQHLSISPSLFPSSFLSVGVLVVLCVCIRAAVISLKVSCFPHIFIYFIRLSSSGNSLLWRSSSLPGETFSFLTPKFKRNVTSRQRKRKRIELVPEDCDFFCFPTKTPIKFYFLHLGSS